MMDPAMAAARDEAERTGRIVGSDVDQIEHDLLNEEPARPAVNLAAIRAHIENLITERDDARADAERQIAGMREVALFRAANAQGCLGSYALPLLDLIDQFAEALRLCMKDLQEWGVIFAEGDPPYDLLLAYDEGRL